MFSKGTLVNISLAIRWLQQWTQQTRISPGISHWNKNRLKSWGIWDEDLVSWGFTICHIVRETWSGYIGGLDHTLTRLLSYSHLFPSICVITLKMGLEVVTGSFFSMWAQWIHLFFLLFTTVLALFNRLMEGGWLNLAGWGTGCDPKPVSINDVMSWT